MINWLLPQNKSARVSLPFGPSKMYSFSIFTQGRARRFSFNRSRSFENFFSSASSFLRAAIHCFLDTTLCSFVPLMVFSLAMAFHSFWGALTLMHNLRFCQQDAAGLK